MSVVGIGVDLCAQDRIAAILAGKPDLARKIFTPAELAAAPKARAAEFLAGRFAAKEALAKALGAPEGLSWQDAEILRGEDGAPVLVITNSVANRAKGLGVTKIQVSISHDAGLATAFVIAERES